MDYEINKNNEELELVQETEVIDCDEPEVESKNGIGFKGVALGVAAVAGLVWGAKKLTRKIKNSPKRQEKRLEKQAAELEAAGYFVKKMTPAPESIEEPVVVDDVFECEEE